MAQTMLQVSGMRDDTEHEDIQRLQQTAVLRGVSILNDNALIEQINIEYTIR